MIILNSKNPYKRFRSISMSYTNFNNFNNQQVYGNPYSSSYYNSLNNQRRRRKQRLFTKDIESLLYALGDGPVSTDATVNTLEEVLVEYLANFSEKCQEYAKAQGRTRIKIGDLPFTLREDPLKLARYEYILEQSMRIERAKKILDDKETNYNEDGIDGDDVDDADENEGGEKVKAEKKERKKRKYKKSSNNS